MQLSMFDTVTLHKVKKNTTSKRIKSFDSPPYCLLCPEVWLICDTWKTRVPPLFVDSLRMITHSLMLVKRFL